MRATTLESREPVASWAVAPRVQAIWRRRRGGPERGPRTLTWNRRFGDPRRFEPFTWKPADSWESWASNWAGESYGALRTGPVPRTTAAMAADLLAGERFFYRPGVDPRISGVGGSPTRLARAWPGGGKARVPRVLRTREDALQRCGVPRAAAWRLEALGDK